MTLKQEELLEAVREWCERRGIPKGSDVVVFARHVKGGQTTTPTSVMTEYRMEAIVYDVEMPPKEGPYR